MAFLVASHLDSQVMCQLLFCLH